jgi:hypothetical protein
MNMLDDDRKKYMMGSREGYQMGGYGNKRKAYGAGGLLIKLFSLGKKTPPKVVKEKDIQQVLDSLSNEDMARLSPIEIEQLMDLDIGKNGIDIMPLKSTRKDVDKSISSLTSKEIKNLSPLEREQLLDMDLEKYGVDGRKSKMMGGLLQDDREMYEIGGEVASDNEMEKDYLEFIVGEALSEEEEDMLMSKLEQDDEMSILFDKVIDMAQEFAGSGPVEGPGTGVSDSIPARLSDGEFVFTAKAVEEIGEDVLMSMMKDAEAAAEERKGFAMGEGVYDEEEIDDVSNDMRKVNPRLNPNSR